MSAQVDSLLSAVEPRPARPTTVRALRRAAILPAVLFLPSLVLFFTVATGARWPEYPGVLFHLAILPLVFRLRGPQWVKAAGAGWIVVDVLAGVLAINGLPYGLYWPVRMGGHVLAGTWLVGTSVLSARWSTGVVGVLTGLDLAGYSFLAPVLPMSFVYPAGVLLVVWLVLVAVLARPLAAPATVGPEVPAAG